MPGDASYSLTQYAENLALDEFLGVGSKLFPSGLYLCLFGATPGDESGVGSELATSIASRYERIRLQMKAASAGYSENASDARFATAGDAWPTVVAVGIADVASQRAGNLVWWAGLNTVQAVLVNQRFVFSTESLDAKID